ncbi:MAG: peptidylprolyl isomerase [Oscillospiraceae bacterium]|nr:peptidylprolyl isomerase [Oscillospiraceae bacterium]
MHKKNKALSVLGIFLLASSVVSFIVFYFVVMASQKGYHYIDPDTLKLVQTEEIADGAPTAIVTTSLGEIRFVLYPDYAPQTVAQFTQLAQEGYYDNTYVFEAKNDVYFAAGSADNDGHLPDGLPEEREKVPVETHQDLWPLRGSLCAMNTTTEGGFFKRLFKNEQTYSGTRFMVLGTVDFSDEEFASQFREASGSEALSDAFLERGGVPNFSQQMTVFGQAYAGLDIVDAICGAELYDTPSATTGYTPPKEDIQILSVEISAYSDEDKSLNEWENAE